LGEVITTRIILARHGETEANRRRCFADSDEIPLTDTGREQAGELACLLAARVRPHRLLSSPYLRARQTAEIVSSFIGLKPQVIPGMHERDFGCLRGHPYERMDELMPPSIEPWLWRPEGGESLDDVRRRVTPVIDSLHEKYPGEEIVLVCHGAVIQSVCAHITGQWSEAAIPPNCGVVTIEYDQSSTVARLETSAVLTR
jgi:probable phosphoglycerate mutase